MREEGAVRSASIVWALIGPLVVLSGAPLGARDAPFIRGDANSDNQVTLSDVFAVLRNNLLGDKVGCQDAADVDDNGKLDQIDAFYLVGALFFRHSLIAEPFAEPGLDPTPDQLDCGRQAVRKGSGAGWAVDCEDPGGIADLEFIHFRNQVEVLSGQRHVRVPVVMNSPVGDVEGLTLSFHAPPDVVSLEKIDVEADDGVFDWFGIRPEWVIPYDAQRDDGYLATTVAVSLSPPFGLLPKFHDGVVAYLEFSVNPHLAPGSRFLISFADIPGVRGSPPIRNELSRNGARQVYGVCSLSVRVVKEEELFVRGDANRDWLVNMSDVVTILSGLFAGAQGAENGDARIETVFSCPDAADVDDDGRIQVNDAMYLALYLFKGGPPPLSPFPQPGRDSLVPERDRIDCIDP